MNCSEGLLAAGLQAERSHRAGDEKVSQRFEDEATALLRVVGARPLVAQALPERTRRREDAEPLAEARTILEELGAIRWLERIGEASEVAA